MNNTITFGILLIGAIQALFFALLFLLQKRNTTPNRIIGFWLLIVAIHITAIIFQWFFNESNRNNGGGIPLLFTLLHGPFLYLYSLKLTRNIQRFPIGNLLHFIPFFIFLTGASILFFQKIQFSWFYPLVAVQGIISGLVYCILTSLVLVSYRKKIKMRYSNTEKIDLNWLLRLTIGILAIWLGATVFVMLNKFYSVQLPLHWLFAIVPVFIFYTGFYGIKQKLVFKKAENRKIRDMKTMSAKKNTSTAKATYQKSGLTNNDMKKIYEQLENVMKNKKLFLQPELNLHNLASELQTPAHHITQTLNVYLRQNFYDFVNGYRVNAFIKKIENRESEHFSLLAIALDCGFNSKSSFNRIFKKQTGITPSEYKKSIS